MSSPTPDAEGAPTTSRSGPRRPLGCLRRVFLAFGLLVLVLVGLGVMIDKKPMETWWLGWLSDYLEPKTQMELRVADVDIRWWRGELEARDLELVVGKGPPLLRVDRVVARWDWRRLRGTAWTLREVVVEAPRLDLEAPLPSGGGQSGGAGGEPAAVPLTVERVLVTDGEVAAATLVAREWLAGFTVESVQVQGRLEAGELTEGKVEGQVALHRMDRPGESIPLAVESSVLGPLVGPWRVERLLAAGEGLHLDAAGEVERGAERLPARLDLRLEPARLLPDLAAGAGVVEAEGQLELRGGVGYLEVAAERFPAELLSPFLVPEVFERLAAGGTTLGGRGRVESTSWTIEGLQAEGEAHWRRGEETLVAADFALPQEATPPRLELQARLLPDRVGLREARGALVWPTAEAPSEVELEAVRLRVEEKDAWRLLGDLEARWPLLVPDVQFPEGWVDGPAASRSLRLEALLEGDPADPRMEVEASLGKGLRVEASGHPVASKGQALLHLADFDLAVVGREGITGRLNGEVEIVGEPGAWQGGAWLAARDVVFGEATPPWKRFETTAQLEGTTLRFTELLGIAEAPESGWGLEFSGQGELRLERPFRRGWLEFEGRWPEHTVDGAEARLELADGVLRADVPRIAVAGGQGEGEVVLPLASLGRLPALRELLAEQPLVTAGGPLSLRFAAEGLDATTLAEGDDNEPAWGLSGDLLAELWLDPAQPLAIQGQLALPGGQLRLPLPAPEDGAPLEPLLFDLGTEGIEARLGEGLLEIEAPAVVSEFGDMRLSAVLPTALLARLAGLEGEPFTRGPVVDPPRLRLDGSWQGFDSDAVLTRLGRDILPARFLGDLACQLELDPDDVAGLSGRLAAEPLAVEIVGEQGLGTESGAVIRLAEGHLELLPVRFVSTRRDLVAQGSARLEGLPNTLEQLVAGPGTATIWPAVRDLSLEIQGPVPARLLDPFLAGGRASGAVEIDLKMQGDLGPLDAFDTEALDATLQVTGPDLRILFVGPYLTQVRAPKMRLVSSAEGWRIDEGTFQLNEGQVDFTGLFQPESGVELKGFLDRIAYRLDYGLNTLSTGNFHLQWPFEGAPRLGANLLLERGVLRRDMDLDRQLLETLFGPPQISGLAPAEGPELELDIVLATVEGVRIRNNLADLHATWSPLAITGPVSRPVIEGGVDLESGGRLFTFGQVVQIDSGSVTWSGIPGTAPEVALETTSTLEDRSVGGRQGDIFAATGDQAPVDIGQALTTGLASYYGDRLANSLGQSLGRTRLSYRPLLIFGEADPQARLTLTQDLSHWFSFAVAASLQGAQTRTYLVDLHDISSLPGFTAQAFSNDDGNYGAVVLETFELGGGPEDDLRARLKEVVVLANESAPEKSIRRTLRLGSRDRVPEDVEFSVELDVRDALERRGFPDPDVAVRLEDLDAKGREQRLVIEIDTGPRVTFEFTGDKPARALRRSIISLYRPGFGEDGAFAEMERRALEVYRGLGYPHPEVQLELIPEAPGPQEDRQVTLYITPGERWKLGAPQFNGVAPEVAARLASSFVDGLARVELALGTEAADARLLAALEREGFTGSSILERERDPSGRRLTVDLAPGARRTLTSVVIEGVPEVDRQRLLPTLPVAPGDPARADRIAEAAVRVESDLRRRGFTRARVRPILEGAPETLERELVLRAEPGQQLEVAEVRAQGQRSTRDSWILRVADLEPGALLRNSEVASARRRLLSTGVFSRVQVNTAPQPAGDGAVPTDVVFDLEEHPRYSIAAGLRWASGEGLGAVVDLLDRNVLGRGATVGLRTRYSDSDRSVRLYSVVHRLLAGPNDLELFTQYRERTSDLEVIDTFDLSFQLSRRLNERWQRRFYGRFREEETRFLDGGDRNREESPLLGMQFIYGEQQVAELEPEGHFFSVDLAGALAEWGGEQDVLRLFTQLNTYRGFEVLGQRLTWGQSVRVGWAETFGDEALRSGLRFRAGGELSVRGYRTDTLGPLPEEEGGVAPGGAGLLVINQELRFPLRADLQGLVFFDLGNVWEDPEDFGTDLRHSLGLGVRAATPIGLLRFDLAWPIDRREQDEALKIYIGFGNIF